MEVVQTFYGPNDMLGGMPPDYPCLHDDSQRALRFAPCLSIHLSYLLVDVVNVDEHVGLCNQLLPLVSVNLIKKNLVVNIMKMCMWF